MCVSKPRKAVKMPTKIPYLDEDWNFIGGCSPCSTGCSHCWACRQAAGRLKNHPLYEGLTRNGKWTGEIRLCTDIGRADLLEKPLHWREPRRIGVQFMGDLFHEKVPFEFIYKVFETMNICSQHTFQILTKRPKRMADFIYQAFGVNLRLPNLHLGVSISTQDELWKVEELCKISAAIRFVSFEPLLENIKFPGYFQALNWAIFGAESINGKPGRKCELDWVRNGVRQCKASDVPPFIKQLHIGGKLVKNKSKFPKDLQLQEYPEQG